MNADDSPHLRTTDLPPMLIRAVLGVAAQRGVSPERLCQGLGFSPDDLMRAGMRVSYRQTRHLVCRARDALGDSTIGLAAGTAQTLVSWGLPGLAMLTCRTFGEAVAFGTEHQRDAGALLLHQLQVTETAVVVQATPRFFDPEFEPVLIEESFSGMVMIARCLVGAHFKPMHLELAFAPPAHAEAYRRVFRCPIHFDCGAHRLFASAHWLSHELPSWDRFTGDAVREAVTSMHPPANRQPDLLASASMWLHAHLDASPDMPALARHLNLGERTLRRRLAELGVSYRELFDRARHERAVELLQRSTAPVHEVALATGFEDARNFRRPFRRWTGTPPSESRRS